MRTIPVVIPFFGAAPRYLQIALHSAARFNRRVVLLGDAANRGAWSTHVDCQTLTMPKYAQFERAFVKLSDYPADYEAANWRRAFAIEAWMAATGVSEVVMLDGDVVTFADYSRELPRRLSPGQLAALTTFDDQREFEWASSPHCSYWTRAALADFTSFCIEAYRDEAIRGQLRLKYQQQLDTGARGGICDMTLLYLWRRRHAARVANLAEAVDGAAVDLAIGSGDNCRRAEYALIGRFKRVEFRDALPYGVQRATATPVRLLALHCQGDAKGLMRYLWWRATQRHHQRFFAVDCLTLQARVKGGRALRSAAAMLTGLAGSGRA